MKTVVENINDVEKLIKVTLEWDEVKEDYDKICQKLRKKLKIDGFRPGKVPMKLAKKHLEAQIQYEFINEIVEKTFENAAKNENVKDHIGSSLEDVNFEENEPFTYSVKIEVDPEFELPDYKKGFSVKRKQYIVSDDDVENYLESVKKERVEIEKVDSEIEKGHFVVCDLEAEGKDKEENVQWEVGVEPLTEKAEKEFIGKKAGDSFETELTIKEKTDTYKVTIKSVQKHVFPEITDEWVKKNLETVESLDAWKKQIKEAIEKELNNRTQQEFETNIKNWFKENMDITVPRARVESYLDGMVKQFNYQQGGASNIAPADIKKFYEPQAEESVRWFLIEEKIKEDEGIAVTSEDFDKKIEELLSQYPEEQRDQFKEIYNNDNYKSQLELQIFSEKIMDHVKEYVKEDVEKLKASDITSAQK
jgi:trigger factor